MKRLYSIKFIGALSLLGLLTLSACQKIEEEKKIGNPISPNSKVINRITDLSSCSGDTTQARTLFSYPWLDLRRAELNVIITETLIFRPNLLTKRTVCSFDGQSVETQSSSEISVNEKSNEIVILKGSASQKTLTYGPLNFTCQSEIKKSNDPIKYEVIDKCLTLITGQNDRIMYPASYW
jgi:hypothetical protein